MGLGNGLTEQVQGTFDSLGANIVTAMAMYQNNTRYIDVDELEKLVNQEESLKYFSPYINGNATVKYGTENLSLSVEGVNEDYAKIRDRGIAEGRNIQFLDVTRKQKVCLVGTYVVKELFGEGTTYNQVVGKELKINGERFSIIGVLEEKASSNAGGLDEVVLIPYTVAQNLFSQEFISTFYFSYPNSDMSKEATDKIDKFFLDVYGDTEYYLVVDAQSMMDQMNSVLESITTVLVAIAAISLLVGGIGIMNIMLVSVSERTREIGIRKAIGANRHDILGQFVIEAITTSFIGGVIGIILGIIMTYVVAGALGLSGSVSISAIIISAGVSCLIGVTFGYLPANKAAKLNPIDALRHE